MYKLFFKCYKLGSSIIIDNRFREMQKMRQKAGKNFKIICKIGEGSFGQIYQAINTKNKFDVAIKFESVNAESPQLVHECQVYEYLQNEHGSIDKGIPNIYLCAVQSDYTYLVMDLMGPSLVTLFQLTQRKFSLKTVLMLIDQMISIVEYLHDRQILHRDIKPENFCIGDKKLAKKIFLIDFGLSKSYIKKGKHIRYRQDRCFVGTCRYASTNSHQGIQLSRRDDMESIGYTAMRFLRGQLPWQGLQISKDQERHQKVKQKKLAISIEQLCKGYPSEFADYLTQVRNLKFDEKPNYSAMRASFRDLFQRSGYKYDYQYDWVILIEKYRKQEIQKLQKLQMLQKVQENIQEENTNIQ